VDDSIGGNALRLAGEVFVPGASQLVSGNIGSGLLHNVLAGAAGAALVGTGVAPLLGSLAILAVKLNSYSSAVSGRNIWDVGSDVLTRRRTETPDTTSSRSTRASATT
jgi:uncharacterized membrane protein YeaQ/YmgE (transglycosylase-associated protein family)